ncbi:MAG: polymerase subunit sigma [Sphingobacteriales bacterium]|nr:polymerase subunit sigma [Sphingobacteriales bacterium]
MNSIPGIDFFDDLEVLRGIREKNKDVFEALYKRHYKKLYLLAFRYTRNRESSEEIVQDVFIKIWDRAGSLTITQSLDNYLYRAVINTSLNFIKRQKSLMNHQETYTLNFAEAEITEDDQKLEKQIICLEKALEILPPQCKKVMMMSRFEKMKQQDIADQLNISIKTVKNHLTYGFKKLRDSLSAESLFIILLMILIKFL